MPNIIHMYVKYLFDSQRAIAALMHMTLPGPALENPVPVMVMSYYPDGA